MTEARLDPRVRSLLSDAVEERDIEMDVAEEMLERTQRLEGEELEESLRDLLEEN